MIRPILIVAIVLGVVTSARSAEQGPRLRELAAVTGDLVRIGDLIENAGEAATIAIFRAPDLGQTGSVPAARIVEALLPHDLTGLDMNGLAEVVVTRLSRSIDARDIESRIAGALAGRQGFGDARNLLITLDRPMRTLHVEANATSDLMVTRLVGDPRSGRFDVAFELPGSAAARRQTLRFTGTVTEAVEAAVLNRPIARGEVIRDADVTIERRPKAEAAGEALALDQVVGLSSKRALRPGQALRAADLMKPEVVQRNEAVTIVYEIPGIMLTVRGKALEAGAVGEQINVLNAQSNRTIHATVAGPGRVVLANVTPPFTAALASNISPRNAQ